MIAGRYKGGPVPEGMKLFTFPKPCPLDDIAFVTQPRITKMESNEDNLKLSTMKKAAEAMNCEFVYYFKPRTTFQNLVDEQAQKKAAEVLKTVNVNMALENQEIAEDEVVKDFASELINTKIKQIWD